MGLEKLFLKKSEAIQSERGGFFCMKLAQLAQKKTWGQKGVFTRTLEWRSIYFLFLHLPFPPSSFPLSSPSRVANRISRCLFGGETTVAARAAKYCKRKSRKTWFPVKQATKKTITGIFSRFLRVSSSCLKINLNKRRTSPALALWLIWC